MSRLSSQAERLRARLGKHPDVSVVIPVYNAGRYLDSLLDSLQAQTLDPSRFEVIAIDDGSTDGSADVLDARAATMANLHVVHQENSGWPGIPRNRGLDMSQGRYVFFSDADDVLGAEALERLVAFADRHGSDVVLPKMVGLDGRWVGERIYVKTQVDADLELAFKTLTPQKMFRTSFLRRHGIRFPEEKVRLEDGMVMAQAYLLASRVSILADRDYYHLRARDDGGNISRGVLDPAGYTWSVGVIAGHVRKLDRDPARADRIILDLYRRKCLKVYSHNRWLRYRSAKKTAWLKAHGAFMDEYISPSLEATLPGRWLARSQAVRSGSVEVADATARREPQLFDAPVASIGVNDRGEPELHITLAAGGKYDRVDLVAKRRQSGEKAAVVPVTVTDAPDVATKVLGVVPLPVAERMTKPGTVDFSVVSCVEAHEGPALRLRARGDGPGLFDPEVGTDELSGRWYVTEQGNLSLKATRRDRPTT